LAAAACQKSLPVYIVKLLSIRRYAGTVDQLAKTDKIDARELSHAPAFSPIVKLVITEIPLPTKGLLA
jgi:transposase